MKIEKNKIVFALVILCIVLFIGAYAFVALGEDEEPTLKNNQTPVPQLEESGQKVYKTKMEALEDLKEERQINAPSVYDERLLDSTGTYDPDLLDKKKMQIIDSIYSQGRINYTEKSYRQTESTVTPSPKPIEKDTVSREEEKEIAIAAKELGLEHQLFFASNPKDNPKVNLRNTDARIYVRVDGTQTIRENYRLRMRLVKAATICGRHFPRNTPIYGFVSFKPNRTMLSIEHIDHNPITLWAYDLEDGSQGIYIENSFQADVRQQVIGDVVDDINVAGVPQVSGIKQLFRRDNRKVKVTVMDDYQLILKPKQ
ncbi:conjugative transposon protein TraM [Sinomicrobium pectinilyticum]|uniref:Conjugative transposon protein TraM n=1 Tax=Sinomicrobium pectinilyticum TaxID=1084421 RepID=A0A3N0EQF4_SINP1|nr:conjugative transposon protein TraM [Sinomicrobium pectinilyticum]RNL90135.1 conjugative transposon protein TraM [Sinomicrobium pectinilyticum]